MVAVREAPYSARLKPLETLCASFLLDAATPGRGFRNFMSFDRRWLEESGSPDCQGRVLLSLGMALAAHPTGPQAPVYGELFDTSISLDTLDRAPRAMAYTLIAISYRGSHAHETIRCELATRLTSLHQQYSSTAWNWYEPYLAYCNAVLPHAMIVQPEVEFQELGLATLEWLWQHELSTSGHISPTGNARQGKPNDKPTYDQQPVELGELSAACVAAWKRTKNPIWQERQRVAATWFQGNNICGLPMGNPCAGTCRDGIDEFGPSLNCGAESTLSFLLTLQDSREMWDDHIPTAV
jgi:hypothetical protein